MDHQYYIDPTMLYQTNEPEASELSFDLEEFINQYTASTNTWDANYTTIEPTPQEMQPEYNSDMNPHIWDNDIFEWTTSAPDISWGNCPLTAAQSAPPSTTSSSRSDVFISFEEFEQFIYPSPPSNYSPGSSPLTYSQPSEGSSPSTSEPSYEQPSSESQSPQPTSPLSDVSLSCNFCPKTFSKRHELNRHEKLHTKPVTCPIPHCSHRTAKTRDMKRHVIVHHSAEQPVAVPMFRCPVGLCKHAETGFKRKDHLVRHVKKLHPGTSF